MEVSTLPPTPPRRSPWQVQRAVLVALVIRELRTRVSGEWMSLLWMVFEPLSQILLLLALFGLRGNVKQNGVEMPIFLVTGMLPFFLFRNLARRVPKAIASNRGLFAYRQVMPIDALVARALVEIGLYGVVLVSLLALLGWAGYHWFPRNPLEFAGVFLLMIATGVTLGLVLAVAIHNRPRVDTFVGMAFLPLYLVSGVIFPVHNLSAGLREILLLNPLLHLIELSRFHFLEHYAILDGVNVVYPLGFALVLSTFSLSLYRVYRFQFMASA